MSFDKILQFEQALAEFTGAPYAIMTDCCTHALELCFRYDRVEFCAFTPYTYLSIPMLMHKLNIKFQYEVKDDEQWIHIGRGGAILLDDAEAYQTILQQRYDGRDLTIAPWESQKTFRVGYHYKPTIEEAEQGLALLEGIKELNPEPREVLYPDLRLITITD